MCYKLNYLFYLIILLINLKCVKTFAVNFNYNYNLQVEPFTTQIYKRELDHFFDKASFSFNGFEKVESIPVLFPIDICVFSLEGSKYATALHMKKNGTKHLQILKMNNGSYEILADIASPYGIAMDCIDYNNKGYVAVALNITEPIQHARGGSPIYEIAGNQIRAVQYFAAPNLISVYLHASGNDFFLLHTYANSKDTPNLRCPFFKWSGTTFNKIGHIPCSNARRLTPFSIDDENYVAVANYADQKGRTSTNSEIYKYSRDKKKFVLFQKIKTSGAVDVEYFNVFQNEVGRQHFLIFGNTISTRKKTTKDGNNLEADSVFYLFEKGQFIPYQKLSFYAVKKFLPVQNVETEKFILLVACTDQDIKIYNFNDWKFEESDVQFTEGALGKGVSNMRIYHDNEKSYLIISNELMTENETNIFLPIFKQEQHANTLRQEIIDWAKAETQRLMTVNTNHLKKQVEEKIKDLEQLKYLPKIDNISQANIQSVTTESLVYPKLKMSSEYWQALNYINQALETLETMRKQKPRLKRNTVFPSTSPENSEYVYDTLNVKTLTVNKDLKPKIINRVKSARPEFENIKAKKVIVKSNYVRPAHQRASVDLKDENDMMIIKNLQIKGKLNDYEWMDLLNNTLKRKEEMQFFQAPVQIEHLNTDTMEVKNKKINEQNLQTLIPIDGGKYIINQDIQFAAPITVNKLQIFERLNNLHVFNGQLDVLLRKANKTQVIEGLKNVTNIKVMEPITLAGKMLGPQLEAILPHKFISEPLVLQGDFMINGEVNINQKLNALDFIYLNEKLSAKQALDFGIRMDKSLKDVNLKFLKPLKANNSFVSFANENDLQRLIKLDKNDIQVLEGTKIFNESLEIRNGFSEAKNLNGIDMEKLENNAFLKNNNQTITVSMKIGKVTAKSIQSPLIVLNSKNLSDYLTITGNQSVQGSLIVENLKTQFLTVEHLNTDNKIFNQNLQDIYQQKSFNKPPDDLFNRKRKFHGSIYAQNLILNSTINNQPVKVIENQILQLEGNIKYVGNFKFNYPMNVTNMTFQGKLNGIEAKEFGNCWLQRKAEKQVFTAAQTFATINAVQGIQLQGKLNGFTMEEFIKNTYWINRNEYIQCAHFENPIEITGYLKTKTLNDYLVTKDILRKNSEENPIILNSMTVDENVIVKGSIVNLTSINNVKIKALKEYLNAHKDKTLYVENAYFNHSPPFYKTLNSHYIKRTLDSVWLGNENVVLPHNVEIKNANFEGLLEFEGPINNINLDYLKENYFSKSKPQEVSVEMFFSKGAECENVMNMNNMQVFGTLNESKSGTSFNFNEFVQNTLKTSGPHIISGTWLLLEAIVEGNLNEVLLNKLKFVDDILHEVKPMKTYQLTADKLFKDVNIENLFIDASSLVNKVPVGNWIKDAVYMYENYTIKGITTIESLNVYNNLKVFGKLNNITYNEHNILLQNQNQHLPGNITIVSHLSHEKRFLTNNIEHLHTDYINGQYMSEFMDNIIPAAANTEIKSHLSFKHALKVEMYEGPEGYLTQNEWVKRNTDEHRQLHRHYIYKTGQILQEYKHIRNHLNNITRNEDYKLDHFDLLQTIEANSAELVILSVKLNTLIVDVLAVSERPHKIVTIYKWIPKVKQFRKTKEFDWLPHDALLIKIIYKRFQRLQQPIDVGKLKIFINQDLDIFYKVLSNNNINYFEFLNETCIAYQFNLSTLLELRKFCLNEQSSKKLLDLNDELHQVLNLESKYMAALTNNSVLIYDISFDSIKILQKLSTPKPKQIAFGSLKNYTFIAVINGGQSNALNNGFVEIYRSINSSAFTIFQSLKCSEPLQIQFSFIEESDDFLIHILTNSSTKPYLIYQYQGVMGFREILSDSILPASSNDLNIIKLYSSNQHLVALNGEHKITLIEIVVNQI